MTSHDGSGTGKAAVSASTALRLTWTLTGRGWAECVVEAEAVRVELTASYMSSAPEDLLTAVARLITDEPETRLHFVQFEAEPTAYRWLLSRKGDTVWLRLLEMRRGNDHDAAGSELWSGAVSLDRLARAAVRCFDGIARTHGEDEYRDRWGRDFPRNELEAVRHRWRVWQARRCADES
ncbi:hypothetical protein [Streptomyces sp. NPDC059009]|uniref:hypothetical protein n=1 Tax=Streptomyces sp. NPDC059009 TaxID=3346694 RepID=UPI0036A5359E